MKRTRIWATAGYGTNWTGAHDIHFNDKRILRINRALHIQSSIKFRRHGCTIRREAAPQYVAKNCLSRRFHADAPNTKWLTNVTEFKY